MRFFLPITFIQYLFVFFHCCSKDKFYSIKVFLHFVFHLFLVVFDGFLVLFDPVHDIGFKNFDGFLDILFNNIDLSFPIVVVYIVITFLGSQDV